MKCKRQIMELNDEIWVETEEGTSHGYSSPNRKSWI